MTSEGRKILIFSGTTEGRQLSEMLEKNSIDHTVFVATEYGELLQPKGGHTHVEEGRKSLEDIRSLVKEADIVVDATHPYATEVTANICKATEGTGAELIRVLRGSEKTLDYKGITFFETMADCADALAKEKGSILFTTGSKDLYDLSSGIPDKSRIYARVLPTTAGLEACENAGVRLDHIIALQGPFTKELNLSLLRQYGIDVLVTKDSGKTGGFDEKILACAEAGVKVFCIKRPVTETGVTPSEAFKLITGKGTSQEETLEISIIGIGMGDNKGLTLAASKAIERADVIFGAERIIRDIPHNRKYPDYLAKDITERLSELINKGENITSAAVLFSGDIGFYSGAARFEEGLNQWASHMEGRTKCQIRRFPGISSISYLSARLGISYSDAECLSLHGRNSQADIQRAADKIRRSPKSFVLLSSADDIAELAKALGEKSSDLSFCVAENLSYEDESITWMDTDKALKAAGKGLFTLYIENKNPAKKLLIPAIEDEEFTRNKTPMTKALIRHEAVRLLQLHEGDILYDVGSGTGSVAIEAAGLSATLKVYSFERKPEALEVQRENLQKFGASNVELIEGEAPESLLGIEAPDAVFIGGSGGNLTEILKHLKSFHKQIRVVITAVSLETMQAISALKGMEGVEDLQISQITTSNAVEAGGHHLMKTENSVMVAGFYINCNQSNCI